METKIFKSNDFATTSVPVSESRSWVSIAMIIVGVGIAIPAFFLASLISNSLSVSQSVLAIYGGGIIYTFFAVIMGVIGYKKRLTTYLILKEVFGERGYYPLVILMAIVLAFWFAFNLEILSVSLGDLISGSIPSWLYIVAIGMLMTLTASIGFKGLRVLSIWTVPLLVLVLVIALVNGFNLGWEKLISIEGASTASVGTFISVVAGTFMVGAALLPDLTRFARSKSDAVKGSLIGYLVAGPTILLVMTLLAMATGESNFFTVLSVLGLGHISLLVLVFAAWTTNDNNVYSSSLALTSVWPNVPKKTFTWIIGLLGTTIAFFGVLSNFLTFVLLLGIVITPVIGIVGLEVLWLKQQTSVGKWNYSAIIAWISGTLIALITTPAASYGLEMFSLTTVPTIDGVIVSTLVYWLLRPKKS